MKQQNFTALVPMGGRSEGQIAIHSYTGPSLEQAQKWAEGRFSRPAVIVKDVDHPWIYEMIRQGEDHQALQERIRQLFKELS